MDSRYRILVSGFQALKHGFMLSIVSGIPGSLSYIPDTKAQDSRYHKHKFPRFWNPPATNFSNSGFHKQQISQILDSTSNKFPGFRIPQAPNFPDSGFHKQQISRISDSTSNKFPGFWNPQATNFLDSGFHKQQISQILESTSNKFPEFRIPQATNFPDSGFHKQQISRIPDSGIHKQQISRILESGIRIPYMWRVFLSSQICTRLVPMNHEMHSRSCAFYSTRERKKLLILDLFCMPAFSPLY